MSEEAEQLQEERFIMRKSDNAIIDTEKEIPPIIVSLAPPEDGKDIQFGAKISVIALLNKLDQDSKTTNINNHGIIDNLLLLEENIIILEKIMEEINYIGKSNFNETQQFHKQREQRYLIGIERTYERLFSECWDLIKQIKREGK